MTKRKFTWLDGLCILLVLAVAVRPRESVTFTVYVIAMESLLTMSRHYATSGPDRREE